MDEDGSQANRRSCVSVCGDEPQFGRISTDGESSFPGPHTVCRRYTVTVMKRMNRSHIINSRSDYDRLDVIIGTFNQYSVIEHFEIVTYYFEIIFHSL